MNKLFTSIFLLFVSINIYSQNNLNIIVKDSVTNETITGATAYIKSINKGSTSDINGQIEIKNMSNGSYIVACSFIGYENASITITIPQSTQIIVKLKPSNDEMEEIIVEGMRSNKSIANIPTRVEVLTEEIDEASTMDPSKIAHLITHSTGIQVQQTSATSNTANVRIQGLDGRYTQILKDGFPLYGGFSGSLSIMQIPPLDLRQVEYIKGSASTLYGGGAISGLINLVSKDPTNEEILFHVNASHIGAFDINAYASRRFGKIGFTLLGQRNSHQYFDVDKDGYTDMPKLTKYNLNPKLFFYFNDKTKLSIGGTFTDEKRQGGDVRLMKNEYADTNHFYKEINDITRTTTQLKLDHQFDESHAIAIKNSFNIFRRSIDITPNKSLDDYRFSGKQLSTFSEVSYTYKKNKQLLIAGINFYSDNFKEDSIENNPLRKEEYKTIGSFINYNIDIGSKVALEAGLRGDYVFNQKFFLLPRLAVLFKWTQKLTTRIGGGMGYRNPTIFNQEAEILAYQNVLSINKTKVKAEQSYGGNIDIGYKTPLGKHCFININQMFFYTYLAKPVVLRDTGSASNVFHFVNANGYTQSYGAETFFKFGFYDFVLFVGYTYTNATNRFDNNTSLLTLTPQHSIKGDLLYALPKKWRVGLDYEFKSAQMLSNGMKTRAFWTFGAVVEYTWKNFVFFGNVENYTNIRQTKYESLKTGPNNTPQFTEVWAPLDGIVFNAGIKVRL